MLILLSPAKTLDYSTPYTVPFDTLPEFIPQSEQLIKLCQQFTPADLALLMHISDKLAGLNAARFAQWTTHFDHQNSRPAIFAFNGDVYDGLNVADFNHDDLQFAQQHLRILSGLYGMLRPLDLMQPYRLEMGTPLKNAKGKDLYAFWQNLLTEKINTLLTTSINDNTLINLASDEYYKALQDHNIKAKIIKPTFLDEKNGKYKVISFYAKKARGAMTRFIIKERLTDCEQLKYFNDDGYCFDESLSNSTQWVFKRGES